ncbi:modification methylase DpnIIA [Oxobacter pfennigii]|uniref:Site-specific DNA-methyltransferase (adenine-specific) n=1 Tax=Oxobacter pfennigii TaxID=36849 RepID=A0A0P8Y902_9CLOT|nr:DNA adenine methylase [Oxobacter pfennigii]KPU43243.1 modification methylase DpnIIA [Oxobacter pfennigii]
MDELWAKPFLKWAGGKGQLISQIESYLPERLKEGKIKKYAEPFLGGGAVFFYLVSRYKFKQVILNDINEECVLTYNVVKDNVDDLIKVLYDMEMKYKSLCDEDRQAMFYEAREAFNDERVKINYNIYSPDWVKHAANMIFLNRTCFNGLYRKNKKGQFNVPFGKYKNPTICDINNLRAVSSALKNAVITCGDFENISKFIDKDTFVYMDPPYRPLNETSSFTDYSSVPFDDESQIRLSQWYKLLDKKGAALLLSESDPTNTNPEDKFFDELYKDYSIYRVNAVRAINSKVSGRGAIRELLIANHK